MGKMVENIIQSFEMTEKSWLRWERICLIWASPSGPPASSTLAPQPPMFFPRRIPRISETLLSALPDLYSLMHLGTCSKLSFLPALSPLLITTNKTLCALPWHAILLPAVPQYAPGTLHLLLPPPRAHSSGVFEILAPSHDINFCLKITPLDRPCS